jgi:Flp pilus assembly protein CpaB
VAVSTPAGGHCSGSRPATSGTVTVEVDPEQAQKLALAEKVGKLSLSLRKIGSNDTSEKTRINVSDLLGGEEEAKVEESKVIVRRGGSDVQEVKFSRDAASQGGVPATEGEGGN